MTIKEEKDGAFKISVTKANPKPDAPTYTVKTIAELFDIVTTENVERLAADLKTALGVHAHMMNVVRAIAEMSDDESKKLGSVPEFTWIDD